MTLTPEQKIKLLKIFKSAVISATGLFITKAAELISQVDFGENSATIAVVMSFLVNLVRLIPKAV